MVHNRKKHYRHSIRLPGYDYTQPGAYFITICTYQKQCWFGDIIDGEMHFNQLGFIVYQFWRSLPHRFPHIELDAFVVMPNHVHGILVITDTRISTIEKDTLRKEQFGRPVPGSIPTVIRSFKSAVTKRINVMRELSTPPIWQNNYYESIVRIEKGLDRVRQYIINNPTNWTEDEENPQDSADELLDLGLYF
jgi:REP element-mobilizing transposase RayT